MSRPVFISYSDRDRECALELVAFAEASGIPCWVAPRDVSPAAEWAAEIIDAISAARIMVLVFSAASNESPQVRREVERAVHKNVPILPFRIENVLPSKSLEYFLGAQHWLDGFPPPRAVHYETVCRHVARALREAPPNAAACAAGDAAPPADGGTTARAPGTEAARFDAAVIAAIEKALARQLGPVARIVVARAAARSSDGEQLARTLADELAGEPARRDFIEHCRALLAGARIVG